MKIDEVEKIKEAYFELREAFEIARAKYWSAQEKCEHDPKRILIEERFYNCDTVPVKDTKYICSVCEKTIAITRENRGPLMNL